MNDSRSWRTLCLMGSPLITAFKSSSVCKLKLGSNETGPLDSVNSITETDLKVGVVVWNLHVEATVRIVSENRNEMLHSK